MKNHNDGVILDNDSEAAPNPNAPEAAADPNAPEDDAPEDDAQEGQAPAAAELLVRALPVDIVRQTVNAPHTGVIPIVPALHPAHLGAGLDDPIPIEKPLGG